MKHANATDKTTGSPNRYGQTRQIHDAAIASALGMGMSERAVFVLGSGTDWVVADNFETTAIGAIVCRGGDWFIRARESGVDRAVTFAEALMVAGAWFAKKTVDWSYPSSPNAERFGFSAGCWTVSTVSSAGPVAMAGFATRAEADTYLVGVQAM
jgi:hypothetical protein